MPQFDFNSNKNLIFVFCITFLVFIYMFLVVFNAVIKFINFNKFYVLNLNIVDGFSGKLIFLYNFDEENLFNNIGTIYKHN